MAEFPTKSVGEVVTAADWNQIGDATWTPLAQFAPSGTAANLDVPSALQDKFNNFEVRGFVAHTGSVDRELRMLINAHGGTSYRTHLRRNTVDGAESDFGGDALTAARVGQTRFQSQIKIGIQRVIGQGYGWECSGGHNAGGANSQIGSTVGSGRLTAVTSQLTQVRLQWEGSESFASGGRLTLWGIPT